jgi:hypothetical protein
VKLPVAAQVTGVAQPTQPLAGGALTDAQQRRHLGGDDEAMFGREAQQDAVGLGDLHLAGGAGALTGGRT